MHLGEDDIERFDEDVENTYVKKSRPDDSTERAMDYVPYTKAM